MKKGTVVYGIKAVNLHEVVVDFENAYLPEDGSYADCFRGDVYLRITDAGVAEFEDRAKNVFLWERDSYRVRLMEDRVDAIVAHAISCAETWLKQPGNKNALKAAGLFAAKRHLRLAQEHAERTHAANEEAALAVARAQANLREAEALANALPATSYT